MSTGRSGKVTKAKNKMKFYCVPKNKRQIDVNYKGFLCSCNNREKDCIRESYQILNKAADELYGNDTAEQKGENVDIADEISEEIKSLKSDKINQKFKFNVCDSGAKNLIFIHTTLDDPVKISQHIAENILLTKQQQTKFLLRLVPIEVTCKAYLKDIEKAFEPLAEKYFRNEGKTFSIVFNHRNNNSLSRDEVIKTLAEKVFAMNEDNKVNLKDAEVSVIVEIIRAFAFISVVPHFLKYKKYNLLALSETESNQTESTIDKGEQVEENTIDKEEQVEENKEVDTSKENE